MKITVWVPDRIAQGTIGPALLLVVLEIPILVTYFSGTNPNDLWPSLTQGGSMLGETLLMFLAFLSFVVGYLAREPRRAILVFTVSQLIAFSLSIIPLFIYPRTSQGMAMIQCFPDCNWTYLEQLGFRLYLFFAGFAIVVVIIGVVMAGLGSFVGERFREQTMN